MEMERKSFDRSREPAGLKKPRLADNQPNPNGRPFPSRPSPSPLLPRYSNRLAASSDRDSQSNDSSLGSAAGYQPPYQELVSQYKAALSELTFNSKPIITNLTIIAGENHHAAKAIAATVCANILEVPSEQKLPSLYLLDSIVKNIGRDYIKYFAARLPEVFCKAYKQIDPSIHSSMRHLFGTWKGVFPPQPLQIIEKELGFVSAVNTSSSALTTSRPDSQSQRPPHSIHVNPKYLERQRLQQSSRAKGIPNDMTLPIANSSEDVVRPGRSAVTGAGRPWEEGSVKINNIQRPHKQSMVEHVHEKRMGSTYGDFEHGSDVQRSSGMGVGRSGRISDPGHDKPWYGTGSSMSETISSQKNGYSLRQGSPQLSSTKAPGYDLHLEPCIQDIARSHSEMSPSWKNSEEEEFIWEMHSRVSDHDAAKLSNNSRKGWTPDDTEKLDFENHLQRPLSVHEIGSRFDRENSSDSLSSEQKEQASSGYQMPSPWQLQDSHSADGLLHSGASISGYSNGNSASISGLPTSAGSLTRMAVRPHTTSSQIATSGFGFSAHESSGPSGTLAQYRLPSLEVPSSSSSARSGRHQRPSSPSFPAQQMHQQLPNFSGEDYTQPQSLPQSEYTLPKKANMDKLLSRSVQRGNLDTVQIQEGNASSPSVLTSQPSHPYNQSRQSLSRESEASHQIQKPHLLPVSDIRTPSTSGSSASDHSSLPTAEVTGLSSTSSLLAAVMKSGTLSNIASGCLPIKSFQDEEKVQPKSSIQPPIPSVTHLPQKARAKGSSVALSAPLSNEANASISPRKEDQCPPALGLLPPSQESDAVTKVASPISNLLSSLVAKGLISASKSDTSSPSPTESHNQTVPAATAIPTPVSAPLNTSAISQSTQKEVPEPAEKVFAALQQSTTVEAENLIGLEFKSDVIRELHPPVISSLFDDIQHQCIIGGLRLKLKERLARHMDWHALKRIDPDCTNRLSRGWYADAEDWIARTGGPPLVVESPHFIDEFGAPIDEDEPMVPADEDQCVCVLCGELFEDYYSQERSKWMFKGAVHSTLGIGKLDSTKESSKVSIVHVNCISQSSVPDLGLEKEY
ncbi:hypothetical protein K2173_018577 [Erythroxylum novogranatense]|uniref:CID domain-containing protein n=1 Tax=Erythroxylum novogranatense TaxID=1862640 RepID=A0AAV8UEV6_9ROSI|nr:hypothetical protein K2173_018577 [Erythroxylum novogranatense]